MGYTAHVYFNIFETKFGPYYFLGKTMGYYFKTIFMGYISVNYGMYFNV